MENVAFESQLFNLRKLCIMLLITSFVLLLLGGCIGDRSSKISKTPTTNIKNESINEIKLLDSIQSDDFVKQFGTKLETIPNSIYNYYKLNNNLVIATNKKKEIVRISTPSNDSTFKTSKGISTMSTRDEIIRGYGKKYFERSDELGYKVIGYIDKSNKQTIEFFFTEQAGVLDHINLDLLEVN
ncbi:hypothetical protein [Neobacillus massiliamazoniensis]|uniref:Uncharacterized protein n=1 Tax=Neobacillus massiliamazoniensis TaxID=1499688 RepID=A0A0U1NZF8_9BACI|nr:hypothetical protein [Neobacillus massiliamazoniensis]CRK83410.1 hypothetical protein BN000_03378 [Neobacillus massiliamazoniensis]